MLKELSFDLPQEYSVWNNFKYLPLDAVQSLNRSSAIDPYENAKPLVEQMFKNFNRALPSTHVEILNFLLALLLAEDDLLKSLLLLNINTKLTAHDAELIYFEKKSAPNNINASLFMGVVLHLDSLTQRGSLLCEKDSSESTDPATGFSYKIMNFIRVIQILTYLGIVEHDPNINVPPIQLNKNQAVELTASSVTPRTPYGLLSSSTPRDYKSKHNVAVVKHIERKNGTPEVKFANINIHPSLGNSGWTYLVNHKVGHLVGNTTVMKNQQHATPSENKALHDRLSTSITKVGIDTYFNFWKKSFLNLQDIEICCSVKECKERGTIGSHVFLSKGEERGIYIVPCCKGHNSYQNVQFCNLLIVEIQGVARLLNRFDEPTLNRYRKHYHGKLSPYMKNDYVEPSDEERGFSVVNVRELMVIYNDLLKKFPTEKKKRGMKKGELLQEILFLKSKI